MTCEHGWLGFCGHDDTRITVGELLRAKPCSNCRRRTRDVTGTPPLCRLCRALSATPGDRTT